MNPVPPTSPLHPSLQKLDVIGCRRGLLMLLVLLGTCYGQITGWDFCSLILLLLVVLISLKMMPVSSRALNAANRLLRDCVPQTFRLTLIDILDEHKLAVLYPLAARSPAEPVYALIDRSFPGIHRWAKKWRFGSIVGNRNRATSWSRFSPMAFPCWAR